MRIDVLIRLLVVCEGRGDHAAALILRSRIARFGRETRARLRAA